MKKILCWIGSVVSSALYLFGSLLLFIWAVAAIITIFVAALLCGVAGAPIILGTFLEAKITGRRTRRWSMVLKA